MTNTPTPDERFAAAVQALIDESYRDGRRQHTTLGSKARAEVIALYEAKVRELALCESFYKLTVKERDLARLQLGAALADSRRIDWLAQQRGIQIGSWPKTSHVAGYGWCGTIQASTMREAIDRAASNETGR